MITLRQLMEEQKINGMSDIQIIRAFFDLNDMEEEGMKLIYGLSKDKIEKLKREGRMMKEWTSYLPSKYLYENYDLDTANMLHTLELDFLTNNRTLSKYRLEWAKENIPNIELPQVYFVPLIEYLDSENIRFKGEKPLESRNFIKYV